MSVVLAPRTRAPAPGTRLTLAVVAIAAMILATVLTHRDDPIAAEATAMEPSPSIMF